MIFNRLLIGGLTETASGIMSAGIQIYEAAGAAVGVAQSIAGLLQGNTNLSNLVGFVPLVGRGAVNLGGRLGVNQVVEGLVSGIANQVGDLVSGARGLVDQIIKGGRGRAPVASEIAEVPYIPAPNIPSGGQGHTILGELDEIGRPTGVRAYITQGELGQGSDAARSIRPPGFAGGESGHSRGHLLGNQLGGSGKDSRNLVTLFQNPANTPAMRDFENQVAKAIRGGQNVDYGAFPIYQGSNPVPIGVTLQARGNSGFSIDVSVINRGR